ncbi:MAG: ATP-dependent protease LonB [Deltaproteobacteria bacterium]
MINGLLFCIQLFFTIVIGLYFFNLLKSQQGNKSAIDRESRKELEKIRKLRDIKLSEPLSEKTRPASFNEIIGQEQGIRALKAALCSPNPQHVIIYGPPGIGKTAAARVVLEEAKTMGWSPFRKDAKFVEIDATTLRFDERGIADPLIGSVHDPIYQGAGAYGAAGIPQPKQGAVTKAHGGILFLDEIGELHPLQMNKLLKVLEDRKVFLESAYYSSEDVNIPSHIHEIFKNGLPADFRLVGATTCAAEEIPAALRSRCVEVYFRPLSHVEIAEIAQNAGKKGGFELEEGVHEIVAKYAVNGRDAVNIIQIAGSISMVEGRNIITAKDIEWVVETGNYSLRIDKKVSSGKQVGYVNGLAVYGAKIGMIIEIETSAIPVPNKKGALIITGVIEKEEIDNKGRKLERTSCVKASIDNVLTVMRKHLGVDCKNYDIHINFPGGIPIDGPSAGIAIAAAVYSSLANVPVDNRTALTGEISIQGKVKPVGGVPAKIEAARAAGAEKVIIPKENWQESFESLPIEIVPVDDIFQVVDIVFGRNAPVNKKIISKKPSSEILTAQSI